MNKMYAETSIFAAPAIILASGHFYAGIGSLVVLCTIYFLSGGKYKALNFDGKLLLRAITILLYGLAIGALDDPTYEMMALIVFIPIAFCIFRPVEKNLKQLKDP
ncbi:MAG: hypothetical protein OIF55_05385 [Amphritea sp.]|nr:hypothetical protein [Amphritea sp.]